MSWSLSWNIGQWKWNHKEIRDDSISCLQYIYIYKNNIFTYFPISTVPTLLGHVLHLDQDMNIDVGQKAGDANENKKWSIRFMLKHLKKEKKIFQMRRRMKLSGVTKVWVRGDHSLRLLNSVISPRLTVALQGDLHSEYLLRLLLNLNACNL